MHATKDGTVEITQDGQSASIELAYWNGELYDNGNPFSDKTGGWSNNASGSESLYLYRSEGPEYYAWISAATQTNNPIDLSPFRTLHAVVADYKAHISISVMDNSNTVIASAQQSASVMSSGEITLDVSQISDSLYVEVSSKDSDHGGYASTYFKVTKVWLE